MGGTLPSSSFVVIVVINDEGRERATIHPNDKYGKVHCYCYDIVHGNSPSVGTT